jgi:4-hydroxy-2-oxoheptanedioate aldolase
VKRLSKHEETKSANAVHKPEAGAWPNGAMKNLRKHVLNKELTVGTFLNLGSSLTAEIAGRAGFDWVLVDLEHGAGDHQNLVAQLQAIEGTPAAPIVRIAWNDPVLFKRVLDLGPSGIMVPYVQTAEEARRAVAAMRFPPAGIRGVASMNRASGFGLDFEQYFNLANDSLLLIVQIETQQAVDHAPEIAAVEGVDVLLVGPLDLSVNMGMVRQFEHPKFRDALARVATACRQHDKTAGFMLAREDQIPGAKADGFTFLGLGSDGTVLAKGMKELAAALGKRNPTHS